MSTYKPEANFERRRRTTRLGWRTQCTRARPAHHRPVDTIVDPAAAAAPLCSSSSLVKVWEKSTKARPGGGTTKQLRQPYCAWERFGASSIAAACSSATASKPLATLLASKLACCAC